MWKDALKKRLLKDDIKQLFKLYSYQSNYRFIAISTRKITFMGIITFLGFLILGLVFLLCNICVVELIYGWIAVIIFITVYLRFKQKFENKVL